MSPADDVAEMQSICGEIAGMLGLPSNIQARTNELQRHLGRDLFGWNRINEFVRGRARRVDGWEKDHARSVRDRIRIAQEGARGRQAHRLAQPHHRPP